MKLPQESILILDFGSQYTQLIARRVREFQVYSRIVSFDLSAAEIQEMAPAGLILSGGPASVYDEGAPKCDPELFAMGIPILGICYGLQLTIDALGGKVAPSAKREYGSAELQRVGHSPLLNELPETQQVWMSHGDKVLALPPGFQSIGRTDNTDYAAVANQDHRIIGLQFHPEVVHTPHGNKILGNFVTTVCGCSGLWTMESFIDKTTREIRRQVGDGHVILGLSGGVDSSVAAALIDRAVGNQLTCIFVNNGLLRQGEAEAVQQLFGRAFELNLHYVDATDRFLDKLAGVVDPEEKRKIIGGEFVAVFEEESHKIENVRFLAQGTTYPDVIESVPIGGNPSALIKSHHNVGGLPEKMKLDLVEPLRQLFKDEVREVGRQLDLSREVVWRQPFPGPGLAVRMVGKITREDLEVLRQADHIVLDEITTAGYYDKVWQAFAVMLPVQSVGVMGDGRTYENVVVVRVVESQDGMTADWAKLPDDLLGRISNRIINEVRGVNRVCYDISSKPPSTIEWE